MSSLLLNLQKQENIEVESDATRQDNGKRIFSLNEILKFRNNIQMRDELIKSLENAENKNTVLESNNRELNKKKKRYSSTKRISTTRIRCVTGKDAPKS